MVVFVKLNICGAHSVPPLRGIATAPYAMLKLIGNVLFTLLSIKPHCLSFTHSYPSDGSRHASVTIL